MIVNITYFINKNLYYFIILINQILILKINKKLKLKKKIIILNILIYTYMGCA